MTRILDDITEPADLKGLTLPDLEQLAGEIRQQIIETVMENGGHFGSNLGVVELTIAMHTVFESPRDKFIWDVSHQCYSHKLLTGRVQDFASLRQYQGMSGYADPRESSHDIFGAGHVGTSISAALGIAAARDIQGDDYHVVAVIGDGSVTAGMALEGFNHAGYLRKRLIVILNDNDMSISPSVGAITTHLNDVRANPQTTLWEALGFRYIGPVDGHDLTALQTHLEQAKAVDDAPVLLHVVTQKGKGFPQAEATPEKWHGVSPRNSSRKSAPTYSQVFGDTLVEMARADRRIVAITAAMPSGTGLTAFQKACPDRFFDVGIAEQHAVTFAAGLASQGLRPVAAIYSSFLQRAYDQVIHDVALQNLPVLFAIDRGGIVGDDGRTHQGVFDLAYLRSIPNLTVMAPKDEGELVDMLWATTTIDGPVAIRYPRGEGVGANLSQYPRALPIGQAEVLRHGADLAILALGSTVHPALKAAAALATQGVEATVINARFVKPIDHAMLRTLIRTFNRLITVEEGVLAGGFGSAVLEELEANDMHYVTLKRLGVPDEFVEHGNRDIFLARYNLDAAGIVRAAQQTFPELFAMPWYRVVGEPVTRPIVGAGHGDRVGHLDRMPGLSADLHQPRTNRSLVG